MRNVFLFIRKFFTFFLFLALQVVALWMLFTYNRYHRAKGLGYANEITGWVNSKFKTVDDYIHQQAENQRLHRIIDSQMNMRPVNFEAVDTSNYTKVDSLPYDTLGHRRVYQWRTAKVVSNSIGEKKNYIQLNRGAKLGIRDNMCVFNSDLTVVGTIVNVSPNYSVVMSLLHSNSRVFVALKKSGNTGFVEWDGKDPRYLTLARIPGSDTVRKGDTVLTGNSSNFPPGFIVGTVDDVIKDKSSNFLTLKVKTGANFYNLQQVHVVERLDYDEQTKLMSDTRKKIDDPKKATQ
ncbi:MAG TPA: rod shape-determining protein MreC [Chitinophagaceae bacterium]|jgi:rod shape-determining protein MreC|nr:rod shape-determining protein MreC [Chitinophagaceae bacterium]